MTGENLDFLDFSAIVLTVPMPPKEKNERIWRGLCLGCAQKKSPGNEFLDPFCGCYLSENMFKIGMTRTNILKTP